ncbi:MAG: hypothetical protein ACR2PG_09400 [Hyphomicrobiaceae bacterium]
MRKSVGRLLCLGLGVFYMAGLVPLFGFGQFGEQLWTAFRGQVDSLAQMTGISSWIIIVAISPILVGGPLALVWRLAGSGINRFLWLLLGITLYWSLWIFAE